MNYVDIINQVVAEAIDREVENRLAAKNAIIDTLKTLPTWKDKDLAEWEGSETKAAIFCLREFMLFMGASTAKGLENGLERAQGASSRDNEIKSLQAELKGVRDSLKNHVDSEEKLKKELDDANARITKLDAMVKERDTRIEEFEADLDPRIDELEDEVREKDRLIEKYKDMADAISDWANVNMPSLDPDDY